MSSKKFVALTVFGTLLYSSLAAEAGQRRMNARQAKQDARIEQGVQSGELNKAEARRLQRQQKHIQKMEDKAHADGHVTAKEAHKIEKAQDRANVRIHRQKHDAQKAH